MQQLRLSSQINEQKPPTPVPSAGGAPPRRAHSGKRAPAPSRPRPTPPPQPSAAPGPNGEHVPGVRDYKGKPVTWATVRAVYDLSELRRARGFGDGGDAMLERLGILEHKARVLGAEYGQ